MAGTQSFIAKKGEVEQNWYVVDATDQIVGRLASKIATVLMGKHRPGYTAHVDTGEFVVVTNAAKVVFTGKKLDLKRYTWYTGYTRLRSETAGQRLDKQPEMVIKEAVRRMLPKNKLGRHMLSKLKVYASSEHTHQAQQPKPLEQAFSATSN
ncbi:MAG: 50S ribosomal protein L13 [Planctomycetaceae bacterium]|nr:50S ribosomal protein L13 [Planctomycetaceae bacterium]